MNLKRLLLPALFVLFGARAFAQSCDCEKEFSYIKNFMETNYPGFADKKAWMTDKVYDKIVADHLAASKEPHSREDCLLVIYDYLSKFKDHHISVRANFDAAKNDSAYFARRPLTPLSEARIAELRKSKGFEGIYDFHDPAKYKIAIIKDKTPIHDYVGVLVSSNLPGWKPGMMKMEGKLINDSTMIGLLFMQNGMPKVEGFTFGKDALWGDWHREGTTPERPSSSYVPVASKKLSDKTLYIKISSFGPNNAKNIDSVLRVNQEMLKTAPNLVLDLRGNGGGSDYVYEPLLPYVYTNPVKHTGISILATDANIKGWKSYLEDKDRSPENIASIRKTVSMLEMNKGKWTKTSFDGVESDYTKLPGPAKIVILIDQGCASSTEQFLLFARQSSKVTFMGQNTSGTLDYSNVIPAPFSCMPYTLYYPSSRSRRVDKGEGIDNEGIKPDQKLAKTDDWIAKAQAFLEK